MISSLSENRAQAYNQIFLKDPVLGQVPNLGSIFDEVFYYMRNFSNPPIIDYN